MGFVIGLLTATSLCAQSPRKSSPVQKKARVTADSTASGVKSQARTIKQSARQTAPDSVPSLKKNIKQVVPPKPDSVGISYENGKWNLPNRPSTGASPVQGPQTQPLNDALKNVRKPEVQAPMSKEKLERRGADSLSRWADRKDEMQDKAKQRIPAAQYVPSRKAIKKLYDSLGISRLDSIRAMAVQKKEVQPDELAQALKLSFPSTPGFLKQESTNPLDLAKQEGMPQTPDLSKLSLSPQSMLELPAMPGFQLPTDSIPMLDSLRKLNLARQRMTLNEREIAENIKSSLLQKKPRFWDRTYLEGILSFTKEQDINLIQASPALGYRFTDAFSIGVGPSLLVQVKEKKVDAVLGYRSFAKYQFLVFRQVAYLHVEDLVDPRSLSSEDLKGTKHSILAGGGFVAPVSPVLGINLCVLYRVNNQNYAGGDMSPWVIRIGISSIKPKKVK
jgi:hypothetical protein